jgi:(1->4)-alpha-D-glucan 1-alpha-D-glucosylmutase
VFTGGNYRPLEVTGPQADEIIAFARSHGRDTIIVIARRLFARATDDGRAWPSPNTMPQASIDMDGLSSVRSLLVPAEPMPPTQLAASGLFGHLPVAILHAQSAKARRPRVLTAAM